MDIKGKGSFLLLLVSTLVLCQNVSSSTCVPRDKCQVMLQGLYNNASYLAWSIRFYGKKAYLDLVNVRSSRPTYFLPARKRCHTADILPRPEHRGARRMQEKDLLHVLMRLLDSWKEPLPHVAEELLKFLKFYRPIDEKHESIYLRYQRFRSVIVEIASKLGLETSVQDFASWSDMESLTSSDDQTRLFTVYNLLRCFVIDADKIEFLVYILKCLADNEDPC